MAQILNIDPQKKDDMFYRYKMPAIITKIEGNGNGIKTVFPNIRDVCAKLGRPAEVLNKFFGYELGAQSTFLKNDDKFLVMGSFTQDRIQDRVYEFVSRIVLCKQCRNPETDPRVEKNRLLMTCRSCGADTEIRNERVLNILVSHYTAMAEEAKKKKAEAAKAAKKKEAAAAAEEGLAAVEKPKKPVKIETTSEDRKGPNPIEELANVMHGEPRPSHDHVMRRLIEIKTNNNLPEGHSIRLAWMAALHNVDPAKSFSALQPWLSVFRVLVAANPDTNAKTVLKLSANMCIEGKCLEKFPMVLKMLWEEDIVGESAMLSFVATYSGKEVEAKSMVAMRQHSQPFVDWLKA